MAFDVPNQESGFMGISGRYTKLSGYHEFGERSRENNSLQGRGIEIHSNGIITIGYFHNGDDAPGRYITINSWGEIEVGYRYMRNGRLCKGGTDYKLNGAAKRFGH